jgi:hypothetical protein
MHTTRLTLWRPLAVISLLLAVLIGSAPAANAAFSGCRADPVFVLSDGTVLDVQVSIQTNVANVAEIHYVVHGPRGTRLVTAIATPTLGFKGLETITYIADGAANQYVTDTQVVLKPSFATVGATSYTLFAGTNLNLFQILKLQLLNLQYRPVTGLTGQHLIANLSK